MKSLRILIVEDDTLIGTLIGCILESMGHTVCAIESTENDAVAAAALHRPELLIVDARLDEGSGVAAVDRILRMGGAIPHVFISGNIAALGLQRPQAVLLQKPFGEVELVRAMQAALRGPL